MRLSTPEDGIANAALIRMTPRSVLLFLLLTSEGFVSAAAGQRLNPAPYRIGSPVVSDLWVDPVNGLDSNSGAARVTALRTLNAAWNRIHYAHEHRAFAFVWPREFILRRAFRIISSPDTGRINAR